MNRKGDCWHNAVSESFATLEEELLALSPLQSRSKTRKDVANYTRITTTSFGSTRTSATCGPIEFETNAST